VRLPRKPVQRQPHTVQQRQHSHVQLLPRHRHVQTCGHNHEAVALGAPRVGETTVTSMRARIAAAVTCSEHPNARLQHKHLTGCAGITINKAGDSTARRRKTTVRVSAIRHRMCGAWRRGWGCPGSHAGPQQQNPAWQDSIPACEAFTMALFDVDNSSLALRAARSAYARSSGCCLPRWQGPLLHSIKGTCVACQHTT
jgi:hypothetical protein